MFALLIVLLLGASVPGWADDDADLAQDVISDLTEGIDLESPAKEPITTDPDDSSKAIPQNPSQAVLRERQALAEHFESRVVPSSESVEIKESKNNLEIILHHNQLFLEGLDLFRDDALSALQKAVDLIKKNPDKKVTLTSIARHRGEKPWGFSSSIPFEMSSDIHKASNRRDEYRSIINESGDLESHRSLILFTHILQQAYDR